MDSYVRGETESPLIEETIGEIFTRAVQRWPEREALVSRHQDIRWSYEEFGRRVDELAAGLLALGLERGDRVGIWAPNLVEWTLTQFATARVGLIQVNINPAYRLSELEFTLNKAGAKALIAAERFKTSDYVEMLETLLPELATSEPGALRAERVPALRVVAKIGGAPRPGWLDFRRRCYRPSSARSARRSTACPPCSSTNSDTRTSNAMICPRCGPASWRARCVPSRSCGA